MNTQTNATKLLATPRAMALAIIILVASSVPLCAQSALPAATPRPEQMFQQILQGINQAARAVRLRIDTDIDVLLEAKSHVYLATLDGFEDIVLDDTGLNEFDWGFANVTGIEGLPDDYYRLHIVVDLTRPKEGVFSFINSRGEAFDYPLEVMEDQHPDLGPRKSLTIEGGTLVKISAHHPSGTGDFFDEAVLLSIY
jgi:hypothetical protein